MSFNIKDLYNSEKKNGISDKKINIDFGIITYQTLGGCIKELIESSYEIYDFICLMVRM